MSIMFIETFVFVGAVMCFKMHGKNIDFFFFYKDFFLYQQKTTAVKEKPKKTFMSRLFSHTFVQSVCSFMLLDVIKYFPLGTRK